MNDLPSSVASRPQGKTTPRVGLVSLSVIADDPRVRRQGDLLASYGWDILGVGLSGQRSQSPSWQCLSVAPNATHAAAGIEADYRGRASTLLTAMRELLQAPHVCVLGRVLREGILLTTRDPAVAGWAARTVLTRVVQLAGWFHAGLALRFAGEAITPAQEERAFWAIDRTFRQLYEAARSEPVDLWIANDWPSLPIVRKLAAEQNVPYAYDTHELAIHEYEERWIWRHVQRPVIAAIERVGVGDAAFVSCVSGGIAHELAKLHGLEPAPLVLRNVPFYEPNTFKPTGERVSVIYHGLVSPGRGLEACIESVKLWRPEFSLTIRGPSNKDYLEHLENVVRTHGVADRVTFTPAMPMVDLVRAASQHDIGLFAMPGHSLQNVYVLPNKLFEYVMAGLALCVSDLPEMAGIVKDHRLGVLIEAVRPDAIAAAINELDRTAIDEHKRNALAAARQLCWENEGRAFIDACERAITSAR